MAEDPGTSFSDVDEEDPQLKIRIPNPRVYLEKQYSQWQSQRGRVRCDYCRGQKLKVRLFLHGSDVCVNTQGIWEVRSRAAPVQPLRARDGPGLYVHASPRAESRDAAVCAT
jgi:hypothetical protein